MTNTLMKDFTEIILRFLPTLKSITLEIEKYFDETKRHRKMMFFFFLIQAGMCMK